MSSFSLSPIVAAPAREAGALDGYKCSCSCGLELSSSMLSSLRLDAAEHGRWHERKAGAR